MTSMKSLVNWNDVAVAMIWGGLGWMLLSTVGDWAAVIAWGLLGLGVALIVALQANREPFTIRIPMINPRWLVGASAALGILCVVNVGHVWVSDSLEAVTECALHVGGFEQADL